MENDSKMDELEKAACKIQTIYRSRIARTQMKAMLKSILSKHYDPDSGLYYYYNAKSGESSWDKPKLLNNEDFDDPGRFDENISYECGSAEVITIVDNKSQNQNDSDNIRLVAEDAEDESQTVEDPLDPSASVIEKEDLNVTKVHPFNMLCEGDNKITDATAVETEEAVLSDHNNVDGNGLTISSEDTDKPNKHHVIPDEELREEYTKFGPEELQIIRDQFDAFDKDGSGAISANELTDLLKSLGETVSTKKVKEIIREVDDNNTEEVEFHEFVEILYRQRGKSAYASSLQLAMIFGPKEIDNLKKQFSKLDKDGSGEIDELELATLIRSLGRKVADFDLKEIIREVDADKNGKINFNEFAHIVYNMRGDKQSGFAKLLRTGIAQGLFLDLAHVMGSTKDRFSNWWNAEKIAAEKKKKEKQELRKERDKRRATAYKNDCLIYNEEQLRLQAIEVERWKDHDGFIHTVELEGDGENYPNKGQFVRVHYVGRLESGEEFESSRKRGGAFEFRVGASHVIKGWDIALPRMSVGETAKITCSPSLAYGVRGRPPKIPPDSTLVFTIELIMIHDTVYYDDDDLSDDN